MPIAIDPSAFTVPANVQQLTTHESAVRGVASIVASEFGLPVPAKFTVYVYGSRRVFEQGLIEDARLSPARAAELSEFAIGVGKRRQLLFNDDNERRGREWLRLIAHEVAHVSQFELAEGEGRGEQWLAEGMAEWIAFRVLERLEIDTLARRRTLAQAGIRNHASVVAARLDLASFGTSRGFTTRHLKEGSLPTYQLAFLMSDYLITRNGLTAVADYFRSFRTSRDRQKNFERAFGQKLEAFEHEVQAHLRSAVR
ncbi:MAG: hypothetical protein HYU41_20930 [Candidatus Rokubacteria bacterium]|nr:hypothetical protein [Candidatus Rokubacteria bacterium]